MMAMRHTVLFGVMLALLALVGCKKSEPEQTTKAESVEASEKKAAPTPDKGQVSAKAQASETGGVVQLKGKGESKGGDAGAAESVTLTLALAEDDTVTGQVMVGKQAHAIRGIKDGDQLRCWLVSQKGGDDAIWRGMLMGRTTNQKTYEGTFTLSNSGAAAVVSGTWSASTNPA